MGLAEIVAICVGTVNGAELVLKATLDLERLEPRVLLIVVEQAGFVLKPFAPIPRI